MIGRQLRHPIYDKGGLLLLLAAGAVVTPRFKELLVSRRVENVLVSRTDAANMSVRRRSEKSASESVVLDSDLARKIDALIDADMLFKAEGGQKLKDRLVLHGCQGYDPQKREALLREHEETCAVLDHMVKSAAHGERLDGRDIAAVVTNYLKYLTLDTDCLLAIARQIRRYARFADHCLQTSLLGMALGIELGMTEPQIRNIGMAGLLHDWGMTRVPRKLIDAPRVLTENEFIEIRRHPTYTLDLLQRVAGIPRQVPLICYQVHERPNGTGYPRRRVGKNTHPCARILNVADVYIALTSPRPFRKALTPYAAIQLLLYDAHEHLADPTVVRALVHVLSLFPIGTLVELSDGGTARVLRRNGNNYASPIVQLVQDNTGAAVDSQDQSQIFDPAERQLQIARVLPGPDDCEVGLSPVLLTLKRD
jgi:HD-GYP domain-containing protein (c-di-GMP phosphodiesterase class II)